MIIIGLNGRLQSGKDTAFNYLATEFASRGPFRRVGFADKLKLSAAVALGYNPESIEEAVEICNRIKNEGRITTVVGQPQVNFGDGLDGSWTHGNKRTKTISGREFLQLYGAEAHRNIFGTDFWVNALLPKNNQFLELEFGDVEYVFVTDVRFINEARRILDLDGEVWHIDADERLGPLPDDVHSSEHGLPKHLITRVVDNNSTLEDFHKNLEQAYMLSIGHLVTV